MIFMKGEMDEPFKQKQGGFNTFEMGSRAEDPTKRTFGVLSGQKVLPALERLCKQFL